MSIKHSLPIFTVWFLFVQKWLTSSETNMSKMHSLAKFYFFISAIPFTMVSVFNQLRLRQNCTNQKSKPRCWSKSLLFYFFVFVFTILVIYCKYNKIITKMLTEHRLLKLQPFVKKTFYFRYVLTPCGWSKIIQSVLTIEKNICQKTNSFFFCLSF